MGNEVGLHHEPTMRDAAFYKILEPHMKQLNKDFIRMNPSNTSTSVQITMEILKELIENMKKASKLFLWLFNRITYVGSYYDGLRVKEATEFDLNVILKLPVDYKKVELVRRRPGYVTVNLKNAMLNDDRKRNEILEVSKWLDSDGFLSHLKVLQWWESIFSKLNSQIKVLDYSVTTFRKAGPAITVHISGPNLNIDVDLVPVIEFPPSIKPPSPIRWMDSMNLPWYIVPKKQDGLPRFWRVSFPQHERNIMNQQYALKNVNRFLKRLRDRQNWKPLASYYIKVMFLWEAYQRKKMNDTTFSKKNLGYLFVYFLGKLQICFENAQLPYFWDPPLNLLEGASPITWKGFAGYLKNVKKNLEQLIEERNDLKLEVALREIFDDSGDSRAIDSKRYTRKS